MEENQEHDAEMALAEGEEHSGGMEELMDTGYHEEVMEDGYGEQLARDAQIKNECINILGLVDSIMEPNVKNTILTFLSVSGQDVKTAIELLSDHYRGLAQMANMLVDWLEITGVDKATSHAHITDYIHSLIIQYFTKEKADAIFTIEDAAPDWLDALIRERRWRALLCELSESYPESLMLKFAIQKISDAGYQSEIATVTSAARYIDVFNKVLLDLISSVLPRDETELPIALKEFNKMTTHTASTYVYTQVLLTALSSQPEGVSLKRLSQEMADYARKNDRNVLHITLLLSGAVKHPVMAMSLFTMLSQNKVQPGDIINIHKAYTSPNPPPVDLLLFPEFVEMLIDALFIPDRPPNPQYRDKYIWVLAYAVSVVDVDGMPDTSQLQETVGAISAAQAICQKNYVAWSDLESARVLVDSMRGRPVVAFGVLKWVETNVIEDKGYFTANFITGQVPLHLAILDRIAKECPATRPIALALLIKIFESSDLGLDAVVNVEMKKIIIDRMLHLMSCGCTVEVARYFAGAGRSMDGTLLRYYVTEACSMMGPPFSAELVRLMLGVVRVTADSLQTTEAMAPVQAFLGDCDDGTELDAASQALLKSLKEKLGVESTTRHSEAHGGMSY